MGAAAEIPRGPRAGTAGAPQSRPERSARSRRRLSFGSIRAIVVGFATGVLLSGCGAGAPPAVTVESDAVHGASPVAVAEAAAVLAEPIAACVPRQDSDHAVFHGCVDWHSAVHGNYALRVISRLTGDDSWRQLADSTSSSEGLRAELTALEEGQIAHELPYGYAWLLILDTETADGQFAGLAAYVAIELRAWIDAHIAAVANLTSSEYDNLSFPVHALHRWHQGRDAHSAAELRRALTPSLLRWVDSACAGGSDREFFDPCATLLLALSDFDRADEMSIPDEVLRGMGDRIQAREGADAARPPTAHAAGLHFSRSWAMYSAAQALDAPALIDTADAWFLARLEQPDTWRDNYRSYAHWVAQFGVRALDLRTEGYTDHLGPIGRGMSAP